MTGASDDEELHQPRRLVGPGVLIAAATVVVVGTALVVALGGKNQAPRPPSPASTTATPTTAAPTPAPDVAAPAALVRAVSAAYPRARLVEVGVAVPVRRDSDRNYQFLDGPRRITVVVGQVDDRPEVQTTSRRDVLVIAKRSGRRVAVSVRTFRGTVTPADVVAVRRLAADTRLLATS